ncbi:MAG: hypothetical protein ACRCZF_08835, partial [Gemmataceae bacterium]
MDASLFGILIIDREPLAFVHFLGLFQSWLTIAGGCGMLGLTTYLMYAVFGGTSQSESNRIRMPVNTLMLGMFVVALIAYSIYFFLVVTGKGVHPQTIRESQRDSFSFHKIEPVEFSLALQPMVSMIAGFAAMIGIGTPFVRDFFKLRMRRIYALAKLGFIEAYKSRVLYVFLFVLLPFLFPVNWFLPVKPEDELRTSVRVTSIAMELLLLFAAGLLTAFSIPSDIKNQNIYTIVSKPV